MAILTRNWLDDQELKLFDFRPDKVDPAAVLHMTGYPGRGNKIFDLSRYCNHGTITGAAWTRLPSGLWCLAFDGTDDKITVPDAASIRLGTTFTIEMWIRSSGTTKGLLQNCVTGTELGIFQMGTYSTKAYYVMRNPSNNLKEYISLGVAINTGEFIHLVCTRNGAIFKDYKNGTLDIDKADCITGVVHTTIDTVIGYAPALAQYWDDMIGLVKIYNRDLNSQDVKALYRREVICVR